MLAKVRVRETNCTNYYLLCATTTTKKPTTKYTISSAHRMHLTATVVPNPHARIHERTITAIHCITSRGAAQRGRLALPLYIIVPPSVRPNAWTHASNSHIRTHARTQIIHIRLVRPNWPEHAIKVRAKPQATRWRLRIDEWVIEYENRMRVVIPNI